MEASTARLLKQVKTKLPEPTSRRTQTAQNAAHARWDRDGARIVSHAITSAGAGGETEIIVPGIYAALLAHERGKYEDPHYWDPVG